MTLTYEAASRELTALYCNGGQISAGALAAIGGLSDANQPGGIEGQIAHLIACATDDVKVHDGKLGPRTILAEDRLKVLIRLAVKNADSGEADSCKCRRLGDWNGHTHHPLCDAKAAEAAAQLCDSVVERSNNHLFRSGAKICAGLIRDSAKSGEALTEKAEEAYQQFLDDTEDATRPYARHALVGCIADCQALSYSDDRGITASEAESIAGVLHELGRLQDLEAKAVQIVAREPIQLSEDVLMQAIADTTARGHVWTSRVLSTFRAAQRNAEACAAQMSPEA